MPVAESSVYPRDNKSSDTAPLLTHSRRRRSRFMGCCDPVESVVGANKSLSIFPLPFFTTSLDRKPSNCLGYFIASARVAGRSIGGLRSIGRILTWTLFDTLLR